MPGAEGTCPPNSARKGVRYLVRLQNRHERVVHVRSGSAHEDRGCGLGVRVRAQDDTTAHSSQRIDDRRGREPWLGRDDSMDLEVEEQG